MAKNADTIEIKLKKDVLAVAVVIVFILLGAAFLSFQTTQAVPASDASERLSSWLKSFFASRGLSADVKVLDVSEVSGLYRVKLLISAGGQTQEVNYYVTRDGKYFFPVAIELEQQTLQQPPTPSVPKTEKPTVELFVMSHCPFGIQMEKALVPVLRLLGDKVDFKLRFVNYAMHGEEEVWENVRQYCIQKIYGQDKLVDYLDCYNYSGPNSSSECVARAGLNEKEINRCIEEVNREYNIGVILSNPSLWLNGRFPPFPIDDALNTKYGVRGSPTLVINGVVVRVPRNPESLKQAICSAFITPPSECNQVLSSTTPSPGFGGGTGTNTEAQCG